MGRILGRLHIGILLLVLIPAFIVVLMVPSLTGVRSEVSLQEKEQLEKAVRRAAVACYAAEGFYPPDLDYIREEYGVQIDEDRYVVAYEIFAENIMPKIRVMEKNR